MCKEWAEGWQAAAALTGANGTVSVLHCSKMAPAIVNNNENTMTSAHHDAAKAGGKALELLVKTTLAAAQHEQCMGRK